MSEYHGTCRWFGQAFDAPAWDGMPEVPTPVGKPCLWCQEPIKEGDAGITMPYVQPLGTTTEPFHVECHIRQALGGVRHLSKECSCYGGTDDHDSGLTERQEAKLVMLGWGPKPL